MASESEYVQDLTRQEVVNLEPLEWVTDVEQIDDDSVQDDDSSND